MSRKVPARKVLARKALAQISSHQFRLDRAEERFIRWMARQMVGQAGFVRDDVEDIEQDMRLAVLQRLPRFDPAKSRRYTFVSMVVRRCAATLLEHRRTGKRNYGDWVQSLNDSVFEEDGTEIEFHETIATDHRRPGPHDRHNGDEFRDLVLDVQRVVDSLPGYLRPWCAMLGELDIREASRRFGIPRSKIQRIKAEIRAAFEAAGLGVYVAGR